MLRDKIEVTVEWKDAFSVKIKIGVTGLYIVYTYAPPSICYI